MVLAQNKDEVADLADLNGTFESISDEGILSIEACLSFLRLVKMDSESNVAMVKALDKELLHGDFASGPSNFQNSDDLFIELVHILATYFITSKMHQTTKTITQQQQTLLTDYYSFFFTSTLSKSAKLQAVSSVILTPPFLPILALAFLLNL